MKTYSLFAAGALAFAATQAGAQDVPETHGPAHTEEQADTAAEETTDLSQPANPMREITDAEIESFAAAMTEMRDLDPDGAMDQAEKQAEAGAIVERHGLTPESYNMIASAAQSDPEVAQRVRAAMAPAEPTQS
ncbi:DUF4168 domain-containing protein [Aurantiacibacter poecillastricola]|uniref:DUF4168 domain-containing protein n=1 Tax=Aurantiacibacter poecillastricola TaxID=3064385 RepID=UPI00273EBA6F|nr:DUF4168 domain-containing protein [Aurantiacibacter sp. 219JJ12-13]MDP5260873.1 DUF4168 domain-containing protein [Aurantiacibacter sp. 219JJ12-13]